VSAGYGLTPYGEGDWGSENTIVPGTGSVTTPGERNGGLSMG
jgi:hypothetical protein